MSYNEDNFQMVCSPYNMFSIQKMQFLRSLKSTDNAFTYRWFEPISEKTKQCNISGKDYS